MQEENERLIESWRGFLDLSVKLSVELGSTRLPVQEVLQLAPSSIIKLSRSTGEGVDIRSGGQSLVRGEIIVIEDRAGVRINEIITESK
jgi:flagellar motor switch protein FliN/FliY